MATQTQAPTVEQKIEEIRALYADAPEVGRLGLENGLADLEHELGKATATQTAGRIGARQGAVSEFTLLFPFAPGGAKRLRRLLQLVQGNFSLADRMGTVHDMRFVFLDNDTRLLFATAYDGDWDAYIEDFAAKIPDHLDMLFSNVEGFPGLRSPAIKDWIAAHQIAADSWYVAHPDLTVVETRRLKRNGRALDELLDKISE